MRNHACVHDCVMTVKEGRGPEGPDIGRRSRYVVSSGEPREEGAQEGPWDLDWHQHRKGAFYFTHTLSNLDLVTESLTLMAGNSNSPLACVPGE